ncbi:MAG: GNAT family N-acetyltransferase [Phycisphaerae bacterium]
MDSNKLQLRPAEESELPDLWGLILRSAGQRRAKASRAGRTLLSLAEEQGLQFAGQWVVSGGAGVVAGCSLIVSPGRTGTVMMAAEGPARARALVVEGLGRLVEQADRLGLRMIQALIGSGMGQGQVLAEAGFEFLARLLYLEREVVEPLPDRPTAGLTWQRYEAGGEGVFGEVIAASYQGSLDCPGLAGVRTIEEVIESHKAAGEFRPEWWWLLRCDGRAVGVLLLNQVVHRPAAEIVYMGLVPGARGRGLGGALVGRAIEQARQAGLERVILAADEANVPARRLYGRFGFVQAGTRDAWVRILRRADGR